MDKLKLACPCHFGLESVLKFEITKIGGEDINVSDGRVTFSGDFSTLARANLCLASAERVLIQLGEFKAVTFEELFQGIKSLPFEEFIGKDDVFPVKGYSHNSALHSVPDCQSIIKKAIVERLKIRYNVSYFQETGNMFRIQFSIRNDNVIVYIDSSGDGLHKRGYRRNSNAAPIKETLAAGIIDLAHVRSDSIVCDPFCGSGTFVIEAAYKALNIAPGLKRHFAAEKWDIIDPEIWENERTRALDSIRKDTNFFAYGFDIEPEAVALTQENCRRAGILKRVSIKQADIKNYDNFSNSITVCNPPYGERMLDLKEAEQLYSVMGQRFKANNDSPCFIISPHEDFERFFGKTADKRRKLYNGMIKCQLYMYYR
ncbi:MAG: class I SAM-dependent RNA methyltransferase [Oscillospiraceae bacterium]|nr:class I SAM-dependent RNA methyltransferase [Oscillospiraceae bacterium]